MTTQFNLILKPVALMTLVGVLSGCLVTRQEVRESVKREPISPEQQQRANNEVRYQEVDQQMRELMGRVETVENSLNILNADKSGSRMEQVNEKKSNEEKLKIFEEAISKLETQYLSLAQKVEAMQASNAPAKVAATSTAAAGKNSYEQAENEYGKKRWKEAIVAYEKYRTLNPTGKRYGEATYKIGASFQELGMKAEAKSFFSEVVDKYPKSEWAKKSTQRLKILK